IAPTLQAFFTERLARQRGASPRTIASYRGHAAAAAGLRPGPHRQAASRSGLGRPRRRYDQRVPGPSRSQPRQRAQDVQPAPDRDPVLDPVGITAAPRARGLPAGAGHPAQARGVVYEFEGATLGRYDEILKRLSVVRRDPPEGATTSADVSAPSGGRAW